MTFRLYDFKCESCGQVEERLVKVNETTGVCTLCGGWVSRIVSPSNVHFKGEGWSNSDKTAKVRFDKQGNFYPNDKARGLK